MAALDIEEAVAVVEESKVDEAEGVKADSALE